jgi:steroid delta-isomerase-like uncharacterized protein
METDIKALSHQILDQIWNQKRLEAVDAVMTTDFVLYDPTLPSPVQGIEQYKQFVRSYLNAFPDFHLTIEHQLSDGDTVVTRWTATGTHLGDLSGIPATGRRVVVTGISCERTVNGKFAEAWSQWDALGLMRQLGVVPGLAAEQAA